jgi:hypothetical protein
MPSTTTSLWAIAARLDSTLSLRKTDLDRLRRRRVLPQSYSRARLFAEMAAGRPVIFRDFPVRVDGPTSLSVREKLLRLYRRALKHERARVQIGPSQRRDTLLVPEVLRRWAGGRAIVSVTDLHIRRTRVEREVGVETLSDFNLLLHGSEAMALQEMMTLVISSAGNVTDSHSDDPDGSNHCFAGKKLWLAWNTIEGEAVGLQDISRADVGGRAAFDMRGFLALRSARWFTVSDGETLFLPGKLTHKVLTLEQYLGVGSFYVALPSALATLERWYTHGPLWSMETHENDGLVDEIAETLARHVRALRGQRREERERWGLPFLEAAVARFTARAGEARRARLLRIGPFAQVVRAVAGRDAPRPHVRRRTDPKPRTPAGGITRGAGAAHQPR